MGDMTVEELKEKKMWFLWSAKPAKNGKVTKVPLRRRMRNRCRRRCSRLCDIENMLRSG